MDLSFLKNEGGGGLGGGLSFLSFCHSMHESVTFSGRELGWEK